MSVIIDELNFKMIIEEETKNFHKQHCFLRLWKHSSGSYVDGLCEMS